MKRLTIEQIMKLQKEFGINNLQNIVLNDFDPTKPINVSDYFINLYLEMGALFLPEKSSIDVFGNLLPSRDYYYDFGTLEMCQNFWSVAIKDSKSIKETKKHFTEDLKAILTESYICPN